MVLYEKTAEKATIPTNIGLSMVNNRPYHKEDEDNGNDNNYNNYHPGAGARVRVREEMDEMREIYNLYMDIFGRDRVAAIVRREIAQAIEAGAEKSLIAYALEITEIAPQPSWAYARAVIRRCMSDGCRTYEDCARRAELMYKPKAKTAYKQREMTEDDASNIFIDPMERGRGQRNG